MPWVIFEEMKASRQAINLPKAASLVCDVLSNAMQCLVYGKPIRR